MPKERTLRAALDRHHGKDYKLEKQKKQRKEAGKRRRQKEQKEGEDGDEDLDEAGGVALNAATAPPLVKSGSTAKDSMEDAWEDGDSEDGEDDDEEPTFDLSRLDDSDSESEEEEGLKEFDKGVHSESRNGSLAAQLLSLVQPDQRQKGLDDGEEEGKDDEDASSVAFSDISAAEDAEDIVPHQRLTINNTSALTAALTSISLPYSSMAFSDHQTITAPEAVTIPDIDDDLNRELAFYAQALYAAKSARLQLEKEGTPFTRPTDYFAEMVKSDEHMSKIKAKLVGDAASKKASSDARKQRDLKKFGKQVQNEKLQERAKAKKEMLEKVNVLKRKRQNGGTDNAREEDMFDVALEDAATTDRQDREARRQKGREKGGPSAKRQKKDEKFGFGGKKRFSKSGDAASTGDMSGYSVKKMKGQGLKKGGSKRLGKSRRVKT